MSMTAPLLVMMVMLGAMILFMLLLLFFVPLIVTTSTFFLKCRNLPCQPPYSSGCAKKQCKWRKNEHTRSEAESPCKHPP